MMILSFVIVYGVMCMIAVPDGRRSERQYVKLNPVLAAILFLPLYLGKLTAYSVAAIILQFGNFAFHIAALLMTLTKTVPEVFKAVLGYGFVGIVFITVVVAIILEGKK